MRSRDILCGAVIVVFMAMFCLRADAGESRAPDFAWNDGQGTVHHLSELKGQAVVVHFWASWCAPCLTEFPQLLAAARQWPPGVALLMVSSDSDKGAAQRFIGKYKTSGKVLYAFDPGSRLTYDVFQTAMVPETVLLDYNHVLRRKFPGPADWTAPDVRASVAGLMEKK